ncbi:hypothetical protein CEXT_397221 [Caerostris extrusa]|uniref:Uncharacterized protein n=1 Tax=Caerostris extrusa TaxID=172846 RepID=A0AAV4PLX6_CAEEX|nr:hypothetical protein CEXT_397221 [Caerostris extrusa]
MRSILPSYDLFPIKSERITIRFHLQKKQSRVDAVSMATGREKKVGVNTGHVHDYDIPFFCLARWSSAVFGSGGIKYHPERVFLVCSQWELDLLLLLNAL